MKIIKPRNRREVYENSKAFNEFTFLFIEGSYHGLSCCLHPQGLFLGRSRRIFIAKLRSLFECLEKYELRKVGSGVALGLNAGAETIYFEYHYPDGGEHYRTLAFSAKFKHGMIQELFFVKEFVKFNKEEGPHNLDILRYN
jgi:hypothetical protein